MEDCLSLPSEGNMCVRCRHILGLLINNRGICARQHSNRQFGKYPIDQNIAGKTAFVTGGNIGIGRAVSLALARCGADVALTYYSHEAEGQETVEAIEAMG
jgi:3-oxoacyl-[acyl-carrier protein] reductase